MVQSLENRTSVSQRIKRVFPPGPEIPLLNISPRRSKPGTQKAICTSMFVAALFTTAKRWKPTKCPLTDEGINKMRSIQTMENDPASGRDTILTQAPTQGKLEDMIPGDISQSQKEIPYDSTYLRFLRIVKFIETERRVLDARGWDRGE